MSVTDQARKWFAVLVNKVWEKHPELVVPGWLPTGSGTFSTDSGRSCDWEDVFPDLADEADILAAAAKCAEWLDEEADKVWCEGREVYVFGPGYTRIRLCSTDCWPSARFAAVFAELGIEYEG